MYKDIFTNLLLAKEYKAVRVALRAMNEVDIAELLSELDDRALVQAFRLIPKDQAADVFSEMSNGMQAQLVSVFTENELRVLLNELYVDDAVDLLEEMPASLVTRILEHVQPDKRNLINQILNYPEDSAGSIMTTEYVVLRKNMNVAQAMARIKKTGIHKETIYTCYVLEGRKLKGIVSAKDLMTMDDTLLIEDLMTTEIISVNTHDDQEAVVRLFSKYSLLALPVLDIDGCMVGIVTVDDAMDVMVDETTEDITIMAAISPSEKPYFETSVWEHARNRIPWLLVLMLSATVTGMIISRYEDAFQAVPILVAFIPMLMDTGGNCGSQSSTLIIRGIALDEIHFPDLFSVMFREVRVAGIVSIVLAMANGLRILLMYHDLKLAFVIAVSLMGTIIIAKLIGCALPLLAVKIRLDPAIMAAPLITTLVDTCSIMIYFAIATGAFHLQGG